MARWTYDECLRRVLLHEGGYTNHPADPGGPTNFGITLADYRKYVKPGATAADVKAMKVDEAKRIYRARYWDSQRCDELPAGVDDTVFDYGVNSGIGRSGKVLRRVLGLSDASSAITDEVLAALAKRDPKAVIKAINAERLAFLQRLKTWPVFGAGWGRRVAEVNTFSLSLAEQTALVPAIADMRAPTPAAGKGAVPQPSPATGAKVAAVQTTLLGGVAHWLGSHPLETVAIVALSLVAAVVMFSAVKARLRAQQEAPTPGLTPVPAT